MHREKIVPVTPEAAAQGFAAIFVALTSDTPPKQSAVDPSIVEPPEDDLFGRLKSLSPEQIKNINRASPDTL